MTASLQFPIPRLYGYKQYLIQNSPKCQLGKPGSVLATHCHPLSDISPRLYWVMSMTPELITADKGFIKKPCCVESGGYLSAWPRLSCRLGLKGFTPAWGNSQLLPWMPGSPGSFRDNKKDGSHCQGQHVHCQFDVPSSRALCDHPPAAAATIATITITTSTSPTPSPSPPARLPSGVVAGPPS